VGRLPLGRIAAGSVARQTPELLGKWRRYTPRRPAQARRVLPRSSSRVTCSANWTSCAQNLPLRSFQEALAHAPIRIAGERLAIFLRAPGHRLPEARPASSTRDGRRRPLVMPWRMVNRPNTRHSSIRWIVRVGSEVNSTRMPTRAATAHPPGVEAPGWRRSLPVRPECLQGALLCPHSATTPHPHKPTWGPDDYTSGCR